MLLSNCDAWDGDAKPRVETKPAPEQTTALIVPDLDQRDAQACADPGVQDGANPIEVIAETRVALGDCRRKHARVVALYNRIKAVIAGELATERGAL